MNFDIAIERTLSHEAGYVNDPNDPGGETKWGICKRTYPNVDIKNLTRDDAKAIYKRDFWDKVHTEFLPDLLDFQLLDSAVHSGIPQSIRFLQRALDVADDGHFGPVSKTALKAADPNDVMFRFFAERLEFMTKLKNWPHHGRGWARRMAENMRYAALDN